jgi:hypothetical protein
MFQIKVADKIKIHILCFITFFENHVIYENAKKSGAKEAADDNMVARCMLD